MLAASAAALAQEAPSARSLRSLPDVGLEAAEPAVRQQLADQRAQLNALLDGDPRLDDPQQRQRLASAYGELGQLYVLYDLALAAEAALGNAIQLAPEVPRWRYLLATVHQLDNRLEAAAAGFRSVLELDPGDVAARLRLADVLLRAGRLDDADRMFEDATASPSGRAAALYGLGRVAIARGQPGLAAERFAAALTEQPAASILHFHLGQAHRALGDEERARYHFANRGDQEVIFPDPIALELQQLAGGVGALLSLGRISLAMGELEVAQQRFEAALEVDPDSSSALKNLASLLQRRGELERALELYERAAAVQPDDAALRFFVARMIDDLVVVASDPRTAREQRLRWDLRAREHLEVALDIAPDFVPAWVLLAEVLNRGGDHEAAEEAVESALAVAPDQFDLHWLHAETLAALGRRDAALAALRRFDAGLEAADRKLAPQPRIERARLLAELGEVERAEAELEEMSQAGEVAADALLELGNLATERGELELAAERYRAAIAASSDDDAADGARGSQALAHFNLGTVLGRLERYRESAEAHAAAVRVDPRSQQARLSEAMARVLAGDYATARQRLEEGLQEFPASSAMGHLLARLLVAAPDAAVRQPEVGLDLAFRLFEAIPSTQHGETVAMALAAVGRFDKAVEWQQRVVTELEKGAPAVVLGEARERLQAYRAGETVPAPWNAD